MNNNVKPLILAKRWNHHTQSGGYDRLVDYLSGDKIFTGKNKIRRSSLADRTWKYLVPSSKNVNHYAPFDFLSELKTFLKVFGSDYQIVHALYAEDQLNFLLRFRKNLKSKLIGTFHMPNESEYVQRAISATHYENFKKLDAAIVVSNSMVSDLEKWVGKNNVYVVPHGIDTTVFCPPDVDQKNTNILNLLSVGNHGRDWETIFEVIRILQAKTNNFIYNIVVPENKKEMFRNLKNVTVHSNIPEQTLIKFYREADVLLLPVLFGTANNTILESLACGTPVISSKIGGIPEYVDEKSGWLFEKGDTVGIAMLLKTLLKNPSLCLSKRNAARKKALLFDWEIIAEMVQDVYSDTLEKPV